MAHGPVGARVRLSSSVASCCRRRICGVATIAVLYAIVRRTARPGRGHARRGCRGADARRGLIFRFNNPDALLTLLLLLAAWAFMRASRTAASAGSFCRLCSSDSAFNTKFLQAYLVLPAFAIVYLIAAPVSLRRRFIGLAVAAASVLVFSLWWVATVQLIAGRHAPVHRRLDGRHSPPASLRL